MPKKISTRDLNLDFKLVDWNIGGAKFLELPTDPGWEEPKDTYQTLEGEPSCREEFRFRLKDAMTDLIHRRAKRPHVITMQEVVQYEKEGKSDHPEDLFPNDFFSNLGYRYHFFPLIDTQKHSAQAKWNKIKSGKNSGWDDKAYFAQGNAILVRDDVPLFPVWSVPKLGISLDEYFDHKNKEAEKKSDSKQTYKSEKLCDLKKQSSVNDPQISCSSEVVFVEQGLYFGDRNTEPRAAVVTHIVLGDKLKKGPDIKLKKPLDLFIINLHLTTLSNEREGIPSRDEEASIRRLKQLDIVFNDIISRYNSWSKVDNYYLRGEEYPIKDEIEILDRNNPVWIVAGDFNFTPESDEYRYIINRNFLDLICPRELKDGEYRAGTKSKGLGNDPTITLDYVFAGPLYYSIQPDNARGRIRNNDVETSSMVSDHMPLIVNVPILIEEEDV